MYMYPHFSVAKQRSAYQKRVSSMSYGIVIIAKLHVRGESVEQIYRANETAVEEEHDPVVSDSDCSSDTDTVSEVEGLQKITVIKDNTCTWWLSKRANNAIHIQNKNEPPHDKTNKMTVCPAKTQISLGIRQVPPSLIRVFTVRSMGS